MNGRRSFLPMGVALVFALAAAACTQDMLDGLGQEKKIPLTGERKALFPQGVPGVEFNAPPQQPGNSNIAINPAAMQNNPGGPQAAQDGEAEQQAGQKQQKQKQKQAAPAEKSSRTAARKKSTEEDPWVETR